MAHDPGELRAELAAECQRVGVRPGEVLQTDQPPRPGSGVHGRRHDVLVALDCLRCLPNNAGVEAFRRGMEHSQVLRMLGQQYSLRRDMTLQPLIDPRVEHDEPSPLPSMRDITQHEEYLLAFVTTLSGDAAARDRALQRHGVYKEYGKVVNAYLDHVGDGVEGVEALRRVTFLLWCSATKPACLTGVDELSQGQVAEIIGWLEDACAGGGLDPQLRWMLGYYHGKYQQVFGRFTHARSLQRVLSSTFPESWRSTEPEPHNFEGRGLMGRFWRQVVAAT